MHRTKPDLPTLKPDLRDEGREDSEGALGEARARVSRAQS